MALTCAGMLVATWRGDGTSINAYLFLTWEMTHSAAAQLERVAIAAVMLCGLVM
ncbi:hypothetical protein D3C83_174140 [compost metagenome]